MKVITRAEAQASGLKRYFTGMPCRHGHVVERTVCDHACVECGRLNARDPIVRMSRRAYMAAHQRQYRKKHPDMVRAIEQKRDKAQRAAARRSSRTNGRENYRAVLSRSFQKHKAKRMAEAREWIRQNPKANSRLQRAAKAKRRALEHSAEGSYTSQDIERMHTEQNFICAACPTDILDHYHVDHMTPLSRGGTNLPSNLQLLCRPCNQSKGAKTMAEWLAWRAEYQEAALGDGLALRRAGASASSGAAMRTK